VTEGRRCGKARAGGQVVRPTTHRGRRGNTAGSAALKQYVTTNLWLREAAADDIYRAAYQDSATGDRLSARRGV